MTVIQPPFRQQVYEGFVTDSWPSPPGVVTSVLLVDGKPAVFMVPYAMGEGDGRFSRFVARDEYAVPPDGAVYVGTVAVPVPQAPSDWPGAQMRRVPERVMHVWREFKPEPGVTRSAAALWEPGALPLEEKQ